MADGVTLMRYVVARPNLASPSHLSFFSGTLVFVESSGTSSLVPSTGWMIADAFRFQSAIEAEAVADLFRHSCATEGSWMVLPALEDSK